MKNGKERIIMEEEKGSSEGKQEVTGFLVERTIGKGGKKRVKDEANNPWFHRIRQEGIQVKSRNRRG